MRLTAAGEAFHARISPAIDGSAAAPRDIVRPPLYGLLRSWSMPGFTYQWLMPNLQAFQGAGPGLPVALRPTDDLADFARSEVDAVIRYVPRYSAPPPSIPVACRLSRAHASDPRRSRSRAFADGPRFADSASHTRRKPAKQRHGLGVRANPQARLPPCLPDPTPAPSLTNCQSGSTTISAWIPTVPSAIDDPRIYRSLNPRASLGL